MDPMPTRTPRRTAPAAAAMAVAAVVLAGCGMPDTHPYYDNQPSTTATDTDVTQWLVAYPGTPTVALALPGTRAGYTEVPGARGVAGPVTTLGAITGQDGVRYTVTATVVPADAAPVYTDPAGLRVDRSGEVQTRNGVGRYTTGSLPGGARLFVTTVPLKGHPTPEEGTLVTTQIEVPPTAPIAALAGAAETSRSMYVGAPAP